MVLVGVVLFFAIYVGYLCLQFGKMGGSALDTECRLGSLGQSAKLDFVDHPWALF